MRHAVAPRWPPIFIIGPPRVGSTLAYQLLVCGLKTSFICNAAAATPHAPAITTWALAIASGINPPDRYESCYGVSPGWNAPAQGRETWGRWFPPDQSYVGAGECSPAAVVEIQGTVSRIERAFGAPFVNKAQGHCVRILSLCEAFPSAVFVRVRRAAAAVAESVLLGRRECFGDARQWFSAKPSGYASLKDLDPFRQIVGQIRGLEADMDRDLARAGNSRVIDLDYSDLCAGPRAIVSQVASFYEGRTGIRLAPRRPIPASFPVSTRRKVATEEMNLFSDLLSTPDYLSDVLGTR